MKKLSFLFAATMLLQPFIALAQRPKPAPTSSLTRYVNPLIGTQRMGHTFPGATVPFGMVQLSPDTDTLSYEHNGKYNGRVYEYCAGYQYDDPTIVGFSHTHYSGTGHSDLGDFLIMPTVGQLRMNPGEAGKPGSGFRSRYRHSTEMAEPDYYRVDLDDYKVRAELTATARVGFHQYTFPASDSAHIIFDAMSGIYNYPDKNVWTYIRVVNDTLVTGYRQTTGWARTRTVYFAMTFSKPFNSYGSRDFSPKEVYRGFWGKWDQRNNFPELAGRQLRLFFNFKTAEGEKVKMKFALSPVSMEGALRNMTAEAPGWNFDAVKKAGQDLWNAELGKVRIEAEHDDKVNFYTALYHAYLSPTIYMDVDGQYKGLDQNIHTAQGFTNYTTFSLWDTYRALHPLFTILQPKRNADMVNSMLAHYDQSSLHMLPIWSNSANENWCMTGYHAVAVIADAIIKGATGIDERHALEACATTARNRRYDGLGAYIDRGFIPVDQNGTGASTTLEYAYDDWAIAQLANHAQQQGTVSGEFTGRSANYRNAFNPTTGFMQGRLSDGAFTKKFDPLSTSGQGFIEGNSWNYSLSVPQDVPGLMALIGGDKKFIHYLDTLFTMHIPDAFFAETEDITRDGIIGGYVHGNEPSHHIPYLYNWTSQPWKTGEKVRLILKDQYHNGPAGLGGNDDAGQMSAWYIFSALGFYPVSPGISFYQIGSPLVNSASIRLENGKTFRIETRNQGPENVYVQKVTLDGRTIDGRAVNSHTISHKQIMDGGTLVFWMSSRHP